MESFIYIIAVMLTINLLILDVPMLNLVLLSGLVISFIFLNGVSILFLYLASLVIISLLLFIIQKPRREIFSLSLGMLAAGFVLNIFGFNDLSENMTTLFFVLFCLGIIGDMLHEKIFE